jgi:hypothetical protein
MTPKRTTTFKHDLQEADNVNKKKLQITIYVRRKIPKTITNRRVLLQYT